MNKRILGFCAFVFFCIGLLIGLMLPSNAACLVSYDSELCLKADIDYSSKTLTTVPYGAELTFIYDAGYGWYCVEYNGVKGFCAAFCTGWEAEAPVKVEIPEATPAPIAPVPIPEVQIKPEPTPATPIKNTVIDTALGLVGTPYQWGGTNTSGFDCSGFVQYVYGKNGTKVGRTSYAQCREGESVNFNELAAGDILCFGSHSDVWHTGIYIGDGQFVHSGGYGVGVVVANLDEMAVPLVDARRLG